MREIDKERMLELAGVISEAKNSGYDGTMIKFTKKEAIGHFQEVVRGMPEKIDDRIDDIQKDIEFISSEYDQI